MKEAEFDRVYDILYKSFDLNEIRTKEGQKSLFNDSAYSVLVNQDVTAVFGVWDLGDIRYIEHFATDESIRNKGLGSMLLDEFIKGKDTPVILEAELPGEEITDRRINFYKRHGFKFNGYDYIQPSMGEGKNPVPLKMMSYPLALTEEQFKEYRKRLYTQVYRCDVENLGGSAPNTPASL